MDAALALNMSLIAIGLLLFGAGIRYRQDWTAHKVLDFTSEKLGVAIKVNAFGLVLLTGAGLIVTGLWFHYKDVEKELEAIRAERAGWQAALDHINRHKLRLNLMFPAGDAPGADDYSPMVLVRGAQATEMQKHTQARFTRDFAGIVADIPNLGTGDILRVVIESETPLGRKKWISDDLIAPAAHLRMNPATSAPKPAAKTAAAKQP